MLLEEPCSQKNEPLGDAVAATALHASTGTCTIVYLVTHTRAHDARRTHAHTTQRNSAVAESIGCALWHWRSTYRKEKVCDVDSMCVHGVAALQVRATDLCQWENKHAVRQKQQSRRTGTDCFEMFAPSIVRSRQQARARAHLHARTLSPPHTHMHTHIKGKVDLPRLR